MQNQNFLFIIYDENKITIEEVKNVVKIIFQKALIDDVIENNILLFSMDGKYLEEVKNYGYKDNYNQLAIIVKKKGKLEIEKKILKNLPFIVAVGGNRE